MNFASSVYLDTQGDITRQVVHATQRLLTYGASADFVKNQLASRSGFKCNSLKFFHPFQFSALAYLYSRLCTTLRYPSSKHVINQHIILTILNICGFKALIALVQFIIQLKSVHQSWFMAYKVL